MDHLMAHALPMSEFQHGVFEVCLFKHDGHGPLYLLLQRAQDEPLYPGMWQVITGTRTEGEHTVRAALREIREETGLAVENFWVVPHVNSFYVAHSDAVLVSPFFAASVHAGAEPRLSSEHRAYRWARLDEALGLIPWPGQRTGVETVHRYIAQEQEAGRLLRIVLSEYQERRHP
jgi:8-oxo-dGTP pyrophosphatase MutT (NUDIX family)